MRIFSRYLTELWERLIAVEFPLLFPAGTPAGVPFLEFLRQYMARPAPPEVAELQQVLLIRRELNQRQRAILGARRGAARGGACRRPVLPATVPGSFAQVSEARGQAFAMVGKQ